MQDEPLETPPPDATATPPVAPDPAILPILPAPPESAEPAASPAWADDLRQLYNAVVEEPLPDSLIALLSQLDAED